MRLNAWIFMLALSSAPAIAGHSTGAQAAQAMTASEEAHALIGIEYVLPAFGAPIAPDKLSCTDEGGGFLADGAAPDKEWMQGRAICQGRTVMMLQRRVGEVNGQDIWRIVDTLLLPPIALSWNPKHPNALLFSYSFEGACELHGRPNISFIVLTRWGKRKHIDWRTGVERAWTFDLKRGRIVPLSTKGFTCEWSEP
jgi:hypothetical protein